MNILCTAVATVEGGRDGHGRTSDGRLDVDLSVPEEMGGRIYLAGDGAVRAAKTGCSSPE